MGVVSKKKKKKKYMTKYFQAKKEKKDNEYWNCIYKIKNGQKKILKISDQILSNQNI